METGGISRHQLAITDHNSFYSGAPFDHGGSPGAGPTAGRGAGLEEFDWYRNTFGALAGEEVTLPGTGKIVASGIPDWGSHFLAYGAPHFDGPWHGGNISVEEIVQQQLPNFFGSGLISAGLERILERLPRGEANPLLLQSVLTQIARTDGFGYAAHPFSNNFGWPTEYFHMALGWGPFGTTGRGGPQVSTTGRDFVYKGAQVWNGKHDRVANGRLASQARTNLNPFSGAGSTQRFIGKANWADEFSGARGAFKQYVDHVAGGLSFSFSDDADRKFIRKVYMSAGTDAHGDFNYSASIPATIILEATAISVNGVGVNEVFGEPKLMSLNANAFGRVRTYALADDRSRKPGEFVDPRAAPETLGAIEEAVSTSPSDVAANAYRDGNTVLTDGPICMLHLDSNCRFNSDIDELDWHDASCTFENMDGAIGGNGSFDGARSALVPRGRLDPDKVEVWVQTRWRGRNDYVFSRNDVSEMRLRLLHVKAGSRQFLPIPAGAQSLPSHTALQSFRPSNINYGAGALILHGQRGVGVDSALCLANPVWTVPYTISIRKPERCPIKPGELSVTAKFGISMEPTLKQRCADNACIGDSTSAESYKGAQITVVGLGRDGNSVGEPIFLDNRGWFANNLVGGGGKIDDASLTATNLQPIACPRAGWDSRTHARARSIHSYAVIVTELHDMHLNRLNAIGKTFTILPPALTTGTTTHSSPTTNAPTQ